VGTELSDHAPSSTREFHSYSEACRLDPECSYAFLEAKGWKQGSSGRAISLAWRKELAEDSLRPPHGGCRETYNLFPTRPSFSTAHRKRSKNLSHIRKTLKPGVPVLPVTAGIFRHSWAVAFVLRGSLAYRGSMQLPECSIKINDLASLATITPGADRSQPKKS